MVESSSRTVDRGTKATYEDTALRGVFHSAAGQAIYIASQLLSVVLLSRLLLPDDFGIIAMCSPVMLLLAMFMDLGLLQAVVQSKSLTFRQLDTLFWINVVLSVAVAVCLISMSSLIATFYGEPRVGPLLSVMAITIALTGTAAQHAALLNRRMRFGLLSIVVSAQALVTMVVSLIWALVSPSYWAIAAGTVAGSFVSTTLYWLMSNWRPKRPRWEPGTGALLGFGAGVTGFNLSNFFSRNLDNILIGRIWGSTALGIYDRAYMLLLFPLGLLVAPLAKVMIPILSNLVDEPTRYATAFSRVVNLLQLVLLPGIATLTALSDIAIPLFLGDGFRASAPIFMALGFAGLIQVSSSPTGWLFVSQGRTTELAIWGVFSSLITCLAITLGVFQGVIYVAIFYAVATFLKVGPLWWYVTRKGPLTRNTVLQTLAPVLVTGFLTLAAVFSIRNMLPGSEVAQLLSCTLFAYVFFVGGLTCFPVGRNILKDACDVIGRGIKVVSLAAKS